MMFKKINKKNQIKALTGFLAFSVGFATIPTNLIPQYQGVVAASGYDIVLTAEESGGSYVPTQIKNGNFNTMPWMDYSLDGVKYTLSSPYLTDTNNHAIDSDSAVYNPNGWNTSEPQIHKGNLFEYIISGDEPLMYNINTARSKDGTSYPYNAAIAAEMNSGKNTGCVEMNSNVSAVFYQDLATHSKDIIKWSLDHAVRSNTLEISLNKLVKDQSMHVEIGPTPYESDGVTVKKASGTNSAIDTSNVGFAKYTSTAATGTHAGQLDTANLANLSLDRDTQADGWKNASGVYSVPDGQTLTRFGFISDISTSSLAAYGNLLDNVVFSTLVGNLRAVKNSAGDLIVTGYWGDLDSTNKLVVEVNGKKIGVNMSSVQEKNFKMTVSNSVIGDETNLSIYHEDYPDVVTLVEIVHAHTWEYTASGSTLTAYCVRTDEADNCEFQHSQGKSASISFTASNKTYDGKQYNGAKYDSTSDWEKTGQDIPSFYYVGRDGTSYIEQDVAPTNAGKYTAELLGGAAGIVKATYNFEITAKAVTSSNLSFADISNQTYTGSAIEPALDIKVDGVSLTKGTDYTVSWQNNTNVGTATANVTFTGNYSGTTSKTFVIVAKSGAGATISFDKSSYDYTGSAITPTVTVMDGTTTLTNPTDYTVEFTDNTNAGKGTATITYHGNYSGTQTKTFTINQKSSSSLTVSLSQDSYVYDGTDKKPTVTVSDNGNTLPTTEYDVSYSNYVSVGTATATVTMKHNYTGTIDKNYTISPASKSDVSVSIPKNSYDYTGSQITPVPTVTFNSGTLTKGTDYTVSYGENINVGTGTVIITLSENFNSEVITKDFTISPIQDGNITATLESTSLKYTGSAITPGATVKWNDVTLNKGTDYTIDYTNNVNVGTNTASAVITLQGNYSGSKTLNFSITAKPSSETTVIVNIPSDGTLRYTGQQIKPEFTVTVDGHQLTSPTDFTYEYQNNVNPGKGKVVITFVNNYSGTYEQEFTIGKANADDVILSIPASSYTYTGSQIKPVPTVSFNGSNLIEGTDYTVSYGDNTAVGVEAGVVSIELKGDYFAGTKSVKFDITKASSTDVTVSGISESYIYTGKQIKPEPVVKIGEKTLIKDTDYTLSYGTNTEPGSGTVKILLNDASFEDDIEKSFTITKTPSGQVSISIPSDSYEYTGKQITPIPALTYNGVTLVEGTDYTVSYGDNINVGKNSGSIKITFKGSHYDGEETVYFDITKASTDNVTIEIPEESYDYTGKPIKPTPTIKLGDKVLTSPEDYTIVYGDNTEPGEGTIKVILNKDKFDGDKETSFPINKAKADNVLISIPSDSYKYTGKQIKPIPTLTYEGNTLVEGTDYTVSYGDNINVGEDNGSIKITFKGSHYEGERTVYFDITKASTDNVTIEIPEESYDYTGNPIKPTPTVKLGDKVLTSPEDYTIEYGDNTEPGDGTIKIILNKDKFDGDKETKFPINKAKSGDVSISIPSTDYSYTGNQIKPIPSVIFNSVDVDPSEYKITYGTNIAIGTKGGSVTVEFIGTHFEGTETLYFNIIKAQASDLTIEELSDSYDYTGNKITPTPVIKLDGNILEYGVDYTLEYGDNTEPGQGTIKVVLNKDKFKDDKNLTFTINKANSDDVSISLNSNSYTYTGKQITPTPEITFNNSAVDPSEYQITYGENINCGTDVGTVTVKFIGDHFTGSKTLKFSIVKAKGNDIIIEIPEESYDYTGNPIEPEPVVKLGDKTLEKGKDYTVEYGDNTNPPSGTIKIVLNKDNFDGDKETSFQINKGNSSKVTGELDGTSFVYTRGDIEPTATLFYNETIELVYGVDYDITYQNNINVGTATAIITFKGVYEGQISKTFTITPKNISASSDVYLEDYEFIYTGSNIKPAPSVYDGLEELIQTTDFLISYENNLVVGQGKVIITFVNNYKGSKEVPFDIVPANASLIGGGVVKAEYTYTGSAIKPELNLTYRNQTLVKGVDYDVSYTNNISVGNSANATATFKGNYTGTKNYTFTISPKNIMDDAEIKLPNGDKYTYTGTAITPDVTVKYDGEILTEGVDYKLTYKNNVDPGDGKVYVEFQGKYSGRVIQEFKIEKRVDVSHIIISIVVLLFVAFSLVKWLKFKNNKIDRIFGFVCLGVGLVIFVAAFFGTSYLTWLSVGLGALAMVNFLLIFAIVSKKI